MELYLAMQLDQDYVESCLKEAWTNMTVAESPQLVDTDITQLKQQFEERKARLSPLPPLHNERKQQWAAWTIWIGMTAAAILLIIGGTLIVRQYAMPPSTMSLAEEQAAILPGTDKALLTLADGKTISLSDVDAGTLTEQGGLQVEKTTEGEIVYRANSEADESVDAWNSVATPRGGQYRITLPDGSKAFLNAASSLHYPVHFKDKERRVKMTGEVYFEVAKLKDEHNGENVPFFVETEQQEIQVLGTRFNVSAYADEPSIRTTLVEGRIRVTNTVDGASVLLVPGQQSAMGDRLQVYNVDTQQAMAWTAGEFVFKETALDEILRQLSRWYDIDMECPAHLKQKKLSGMVSRTTPLSTLIKMMESTSDLKIIRKERRLMVSE